MIFKTAFTAFNTACCTGYTVRSPLQPVLRNLLLLLALLLPLITSPSLVSPLSLDPPLTSLIVAPRGFTVSFSGLVAGGDTAGGHNTCLYLPLSRDSRPGCKVKQQVKIARLCPSSSIVQPKATSAQRSKPMNPGTNVILDSLIQVSTGVSGLIGWM